MTSMNRIETAVYMKALKAGYLAVSEEAIGNGEACATAAKICAELAFKSGADLDNLWNDIRPCPAELPSSTWSTHSWNVMVDTWHKMNDTATED